MKNIIEIKETDNGSVVSGKKLHEALGIKTRYKLWIKRMLDYGFTEGVDYVPVNSDTPNNQLVTDMALTLDCAKQISMVQRSAKGKEVRLYFIEVEKIAKSLSGLSEEEKQGLNRVNQVNGTYGVKDYLIKRFGKNEGIQKFIEWSKYSHKVITGRTTRQTKSLGKKAGLKTAQRSSAKEVCRNIEPHNGFGLYIADLAASISGDAKLAAGMGKVAAGHLLQKGLPIKTVSKEVIPFS